MTADQRDTILLEFYRRSIDQAKRYLENKYPLEETNQNQPEIDEIVSKLPVEYSNALVWTVKYQGSWREFELIVVIPTTFPDTFPRIYLPKVDFESISPIPHIDQNRFVCTRDPSTVTLNDTKPGEAIEALLQIAVYKIIEAGIKKENELDFIDEFLAYWNSKCSMSAIGIFDPDIQSTGLYWLPLSHPFLESKYVITTSPDEARRWLEPYAVKVEPAEIEKVIYLPLLDSLPPDITQRRQDIPISILKNLPSGYKGIIQTYLNRQGEKIICSFPQRSERVLFGWRQIQPKAIKGFRSNHAPLSVRLLYSTNDMIEKIRIVRIDRGRILRRAGADRASNLKEKCVGVVGCGSVGSYVSMSLAKAGISKFLLVDKELLELDNIGRHLCGFVDASKKLPKVDAVKQALTNQLPGLECITYPDDVLNLMLDKGTELFQHCSLVVVATANMAVERRLNYMVKTSAFDRPVIYLWVEPLGIGGHILYISPTDGGCYQCCFNEKGEFLYSIASSKNESMRREAGCQTIYSPVASLDTEEFVTIAARKVLDIIDNPHHSMLYTWLGDLEVFKTCGYFINDMYVADSSRTLVERPLDRRTWCPQCGGAEAI